MTLDEIQICSENLEHNDETCQYQNIESPEKNKPKKPDEKRDSNGENDNPT